MRNLLTIRTFLVLFLAACSIVGARVIQAATELARINSTVITLESFNTIYRENLKFFQFKTPSQKSVLDDLVKRELGIQEAKKLGLDKDPAVQDRMNTVLYHALIEKKLSKDFESIHITEEEAKDFYNRNPEIRTSHIFVEVRPDAKPEDVKKARDKIQSIYDSYVKDGKMSFAEVAQRFSEGAAAPLGGDMDYQSKDRADPTYYEAAVRLKSPGKISPVVRTQFGFHIIKLTAIRPWDEVDKSQVKRLVFEERRSQIYDRYMSQLRNQAKVTVHPELLKD